MGIPDDVYIHPSSVLFNRPPPDYVVYLEVVRTSRVWMKGLLLLSKHLPLTETPVGLTVVNAVWLSSLGKSLCTFSKPIKTKDGRVAVIPHFGHAGWELPPIDP